MTAEPAERASGPPLGASAVPWSVCARKLRAWVVTATLWDACSQCAGIRQCKLRSAEERRCETGGGDVCRLRSSECDGEGREHHLEPKLSRKPAPGAQRLGRREIQDAGVDRWPSEHLPG